MTRETKRRPKKTDDGVITKNCDITGLFPIYSQFGATRMRNSGSIVSKTYIFIKSNVLSYKNKAFTLLLSVKVLFWPKNANFSQINADISKIKRVLILKGISSKITYGSVLRCQIPSFRQEGVILPPPSTSKQIPKSPPRLKLKKFSFFFRFNLELNGKDILKDKWFF